MEYRTVAFTCLMLLAGCNYTEGACWRRGEGGAIGGVGGSFTEGVGVGVGGFGVSPEPQSLGDEPECNLSDAPALDPDKAVVCRKKAWGVDCMIKCGEEGLSCRPEIKHPDKPEVGNGKLWKCAGKPQEEECSYAFDNGDQCKYYRKRNQTLCKYGSEP